MTRLFCLLSTMCWGCYSKETELLLPSKFLCYPVVMVTRKKSWYTLGVEKQNLTLHPVLYSRHWCCVRKILFIRDNGKFSPPGTCPVSCIYTPLAKWKHNIQFMFWKDKYSHIAQWENLVAAFQSMCVNTLLKQWP